MPHTAPLQRAMTVAGRQFGALSLLQAQQAGLTENQVRGLVERGAWHRRARGLFTVAGSPGTPQRDAMVAYLAAATVGGVVSHLSAAALHGLAAHPARPHVTVPPGARAASPVADVHRSEVPPVDRAHRGPFATTSVSRTLVDCAAVLDRPALTDLVDEAFCRKLASQASIHAAADRLGPGRHGTLLVRHAAEVWSPHVTPGSPAEVRALRLLTELGIEGLVAQYEVMDEHGTFVARLDLAAPSRRLGFEYDGIRFHGPRRWARDEARYGGSARWDGRWSPSTSSTCSPASRGCAGSWSAGRRAPQPRSERGSGAHLVVSGARTGGAPRRWGWGRSRGGSGR